MTRRLVIDGNAVYELDETYKLQKNHEREYKVASDKVEGTEGNQSGKVSKKPDK